MSKCKILFLTRYGEMGASSRIRTFQYFSYLIQSGFVVVWEPLIKDDALDSKYKTGSYGFFYLCVSYIKRIYTIIQARKYFNLIVVEKEALPWVPVWFEILLLSRLSYVLDYDDAVFHNYDLHRSSFVRRIFSKRLDVLMSSSKLVIAGNEYLANRASRADASWIEIIPTVIDLYRYPLPAAFGGSDPADPFCIVWIGSPSTAQYLKLIEKALQAFAQKWPVVLRVIGADFYMAGIQVECVQWTEATEVESIAAGHVGVMPLQDSPWEQGKCGYKLIQYMACGLPVVASPVGVNNQIVEHCVNGFLARSDDEWVMALEQLFAHAQLRHRMGKAGRAKVEAQYCIQKTGPKMAELLKKAARGG